METAKKKHLHQLYIELVKLQNEVILEGRDAAGKDGAIKRIIKHLSPRELRVVALGKPTDKENRELYFQRYTTHLPIGGEVVLFNRSWYNRVGVERVMGFCTDKEYDIFFKDVEMFEKILANSGFILIKYYLDISKKEQRKRLEDRRNNPLKKWKISPIDEKAQSLWKEYSNARSEMLLKTNFKYAPWFIANAENKKDLHIDLITHLLQQVDYKNKDKKLLENNPALICPASTRNIENVLYE
jgi:polyphosphate kinase 2